jgi:asparagine synthase (glutamine-hydrolysing)
MCGIVGVISDSSEFVIKKCNDLISHRGPDDEGYFYHNKLAFGHRRLSIQDLSTNGHQPMESDDGDWVILFNGEIYNHWEIRENLKIKYNFKSNSDTETLLYGYIEFGVGILDLLNGIFAFAIYHKSTGDLVIVRDQFGVKPLYYYVDENVFWFGSELKSILPLTFDHELDFSAFKNYLTFLYSPGTQTPFKKVLKLLPGHYITTNVSRPNSFKVIKYYDLKFDNSRFEKSEEKLIDELEKKLIRAVERQMISDVPVGFFLSGGLDSSAIVAIAKKLYPNRKFHCYTIKNESEDLTKEGFVEDLYYAKRVAQYLDVNLIEVENRVDIISDFDSMIYHLDEPQADPAPLSVLNICKRAREDGHFVLLSGTAGDDVFSGYRRHQALNAECYINNTPVLVRKFIQVFLSLFTSNFPIIRRAKKLTKNLTDDQIDRILGYFSWMDGKILNGLFSHDAKKSVLNYKPLNILKEGIKNIPLEKSLLNQMLYLEMKSFLVDHNLNYTDKMSMATGVEVRVPFLDKELVEFSLKIPVELKMKGVTTKYILKKVMERYLPHDIIYRPKAGFGAPVRSWIINDMEPMIADYLSKENIERSGVFDFESVQRLIQDNRMGKVDASYTIWSMLAIESWLRQFYQDQLKDK